MGDAFPGGRSVIREAFRRGGIPDASIDIVLASITLSTLKQYNCALKAWWQFCHSISHDVFKLSVPIVLTFLTEQSNKGAAYGSLNSARSALALLLSERLSSNSSIKRFFKGIAHLKPPRPRYDWTWDPSPVIQFLGNLYPNENQSLQSVTEKLATLLALVTAQRVQTLSVIEITNIVYKADGVEIKIPQRIKTSGKNRLQPVMWLPKFSDKPNVCVVACLESYIKKTETIRLDNKLFICCKRPYSAASSQSISRWIKSTLSKAGLDTSNFTAHSTRHASTSCANRKGVDVNIILRTAGWSSTSRVFADFYNRPLENRSAFAKALID